MVKYVQCVWTNCVLIKVRAIVIRSRYASQANLWNPFRLLTDSPVSWTEPFKGIIIEYFAVAKPVFIVSIFVGLYICQKNKIGFCQPTSVTPRIFLFCRVFISTFRMPYCPYLTMYFWHTVLELDLVRVRWILVRAHIISSSTVLTDVAHYVVYHVSLDGTSSSFEVFSSRYCCALLHEL